MNSKTVAILLSLTALYALFIYRSRAGGFVQVDGLALNNPGLIKSENGVQLLGEMVPSSAPPYAQFLAPTMGVYAIAKKLASYGAGVLSIREVVTAWANYRGASADNYVAFVSSKTGLSGVDSTSGKQRDIIKAIIEKETGTTPYDDLTIDQGVNMLLVNW